MLTRLTAGLIGLLAPAAIALAQQAYEDPKIKAQDASTIAEWGIGALFLVGCFIVAFKPSKRSNLK